MKILLLVAAVVLASCSSGPKPTDPDALGKKIFELLKAGDKKAISDYFITQSELKQVLKKSPNWAVLTTSQQDETVDKAYENLERDFSRLVDFYTDPHYETTKLLRGGEYLSSSYVEYPDNGGTVTHIKTGFVSGDKNYVLFLKAANLETYWKLTGWIEVKEHE